MSRQVERVLAVGFVLVLIVSIWVTFSLLGPSRRAAEEDQGPPRQAPDFTAALLSGPDFKLSEHRGKIVIVDFWATWCGPCEIQMPILDRLWKEEGDRDLVVVGVSVDTDPAETVEAWVNERGFEYPIALGDQDLATRYGVIGFPTLFILDPSGGIRTQHVGVLSRPELEEILNEIRLDTRPTS